MNSLKFVFFFSFFIFCTFGFSQTLVEKYEKESIHLRTGGFTKGGVNHSALFSYRGLKKEMKSSPAARLEYQRYNEKKNWGMTLALGGLAALIGALGTENVQLQRGLLLGGLGASIASIPLVSKSANHLHKSIWLYNRDLLLPEHQSTGK